MRARTLAMRRLRKLEEEIYNVPECVKTVRHSIRRPHGNRLVYLVAILTAFPHPVRFCLSLQRCTVATPLQNPCRVVPHAWSLEPHFADSDFADQLTKPEPTECRRVAMWDSARSHSDHHRQPCPLLLDRAYDEWPRLNSAVSLACAQPRSFRPRNLSRGACNRRLFLIRFALLPSFLILRARAAPLFPCASIMSVRATAIIIMRPVPIVNELLPCVLPLNSSESLAHRRAHPLR
jgi:hypothetical protein